jgi:hypothetical protein
MSTRSTCHFVSGDYKPAIIYRHSDGYPEGAGTDIKTFLKLVKDTVADTRFNDPAYLAAKYVVWLSGQFAEPTEEAIAQYAADNSLDLKDFRTRWEARLECQRRGLVNKLNFLSVGIMSEDPGDIEYRYIVDCNKFDDNGLPIVTCENVYGGEICEIPEP